MSTGKVLKQIAFTAASQEHHVSIKVKSVLKWLKSGHEVRISINGKADRQKAMESIYKQLESQAKSGAEIKQKMVKPDSIKFNMRPTKDAASIVVDESSFKDQDIDDLESITTGKDVFSEDFEKELDESLKNERNKPRRR